ncbi:hypothetical protein CCR75_007088 [Bremia lactucae]|uniref:M96 mating-specific protein family n=1 Tax=Bremia lactucae TaxID=4779 RepID=A0A976FGJ9_BRELC|nr:hypothetical protein CCR75_007088 [Bremia lactucae]
MDNSILNAFVDFLKPSNEHLQSAAGALTPSSQESLEHYADVLPFEVFLPLPTVAHHLKDASASTIATKARRSQSKDTVRRSLYRKRQQAEKEALYHEIDALKTQVDTLLNMPASRTVLSTMHGPRPHELWKAIALRQRHHRQAAEEERLHLRTAITSRAALIENLHTSLRKRAHGSTISVKEFPNAPLLRPKGTLATTDAALFQVFLQELPAVYLQADDVVKACELASVAGPSMITRHQVGATEYYKHVERQMIPFPFDETANSMWRLRRLTHRQMDRETIPIVDDPDNTLAMKFRIVTTRQQDEKVSLLQRVVIRRYQEPNRVVIVWKVFTEGEALYQGMHSNETGWGILRPMTANAATGTVFDTCSRHVMMHFTSSSTRPRIVNDFTDLILNTGDEETTIAIQNLEKMLLDAALEQIRL